MKPPPYTLKLTVPPYAKLNVQLQHAMPGNRINFSGCDALEIGAASTTDSLFDTSANEVVLPSDEMNYIRITYADGFAMIEKLQNKAPTYFTLKIYRYNNKFHRQKSVEFVLNNHKWHEKTLISCGFAADKECCAAM